MADENFVIKTELPELFGNFDAETESEKMKHFLLDKKAQTRSNEEKSKKKQNVDQDSIDLIKTEFPELFGNIDAETKPEKSKRFSNDQTRSNGKESTKKRKVDKNFVLVDVTNLIQSENKDDIKKGKIGCRYCSKNYYQTIAYENHWTRHHRGVNRAEMYENSEQCKKCGRFFQHEQSLRVHYGCAHGKKENETNNSGFQNKASMNSLGAQDQNADPRPNDLNPGNGYPGHFLADSANLFMELQPFGIYPLIPSNQTKADCLPANAVDSGKGQESQICKERIIGREELVNSKPLTFGSEMRVNIKKEIINKNESKNENVFVSDRGEKPIRCSICKSGSYTVADLRNHYLMYHGHDFDSKNTKLDDFYKHSKKISSSSSSTLGDARKIKDGDRPKENKISVQNVSASNWNQNRRKIVIVCRICEMKFFELHVYRRHFDKQHADDGSNNAMSDNFWKCGQCGKVYDELFLLQAHYSHLHKETYNKEKFKKMHKRIAKYLNGQSKSALCSSQ